MTKLKDTLAYRYAAAAMDGRHSFTYKKQKHNCYTSEITKLTFKRFFDDIKEKKFELSVASGYAMIQFVETCLKFYKGSKKGQPFELEAWQHFYYMNLYGWKNGRFKRFLQDYLEIARKNGKTHMLAIRALFHILLEGENAAQVYAGATKEEQARIVVNDAGKIAKASPFIKGMFDLKSKDGLIRHLYSPTMDSFMRALGQDSDTDDGFDPSYGIIDEYHAHKNDKTIEIIESGMVSRENPVISIITTAGFDFNSPCYKITRKTGLDVLNGVIRHDEGFYMIYCMDEKDDPDDPKNWVKSNPNMGASVVPETFMKRYNNAKTQGSTKWSKFRTKNLNEWVNSPDTWIRKDIVIANDHGIELAELLGKDCYVGFDLATATDMSSASFFFPNVRENVHAIKVYFYLPEEKVRDRNDGWDYSDHVKNGFIKVTGLAKHDNRFLAKDIIDNSTKYNIKMIGFDPYVADHQVITELRDLDVEGIQVAQGPGTLHLPTDTFESIISAREADLLKNPVLIQQFDNVQIKIDHNGNKKPDKKLSAGKIDGIAATNNAIAAWIHDTAEEKEEEPQIFII
jgi:phage terminase large subunit-like protein